jgi:hypothetical protein
MSERALALGKSPAESKAIQVFMLWGGYEMMEACEKEIEHGR